MGMGVRRSEFKPQGHWNWRGGLLLVCACFTLIAALVAGQMVRGAEVPAPNALRVLPAGKLPDDRRLGPLKENTGYFPFTPPKTRDEWEDRAERLRRQVRVANGL